MTRIKLHLTGGDGFGWALDEDLRMFRAGLPSLVEEVPLRDADVIYSPLVEGLAHLGTEALTGKKILCGFDNPLYHWITRPRFRAVKDVVGLWVAHNREAMTQAASIGLPCDLVPHALRTEIFRPLPDGQRQALRERWGIPRDRYVIGNFQRDTEGADLRMPKRQKAPDVFAEIVRELHERGLPIHVVLAGPRRHWLRDKLTDYAVPFTCIGKVTAGDDLKTNILPREELSELYQAIDLYLLTSRWEGGPYAVLEAAGTRCKILSTRVGLAEDVLERESLFDGLPGAVAAIAADIADGSLSRSVEPQYRRIFESHTEEAIRPHVARIFDRIESVPVFQALPEANASAIPVARPNTVLARLNRAVRRIIPARPAGAGRTVSIFREYVKPPYGGGNQFMLALRAEMQARGVRVLNNQVGDSIDGYIFDSLWFDQKLLNKLARLQKPKVVHRIDGPIYLYRGKDRELDDRIFEINNEFATTTVIQSLFTLQQIYGSGYKPVNPVVIRNASDPAIFNRADKAPFESGQKLRLISSSWSNNPRKGGDIYKWLDENLDWSRYDYSFLGRASAGFQNIRQFDAVPSKELAAHLKRCDVYITASQNDPCSNALIEALSCGLPAIYLRSGGHPELVGTGGIGFDTPEEIPAALEQLAAHYRSFQSCIQVHSIAEIADNYLACLDDR